MCFCSHIINIYINKTININSQSCRNINSPHFLHRYSLCAFELLAPRVLFEASIFKSGIFHVSIHMAQNLSAGLQFKPGPVFFHCYFGMWGYYVMKWCIESTKYKAWTFILLDTLALFHTVGQVISYLLTLHKGVLSASLHVLQSYSAFYEFLSDWETCWSVQVMLPLPLPGIHDTADKCDQGLTPLFATAPAITCAEN